MDELLIEDKKYVSSKRAAKITGYAKDYIGQLCREGRVPARLVGRSWYVLESAIQDHRFGQTESTTEMLASTPPAPQKAWESPRYEASVDRPIPPVSNDAHATLNDSWKAWFDRVNAVVQPIAEIVEEEVIVEAPVEEPAPKTQVAQTIELAEDVSVPIHTIYELPPDELLPHRDVRRDAPRHSLQQDTRSPVEETVEYTDEEEPTTAIGGTTRRIYRAFSTLAVLCAVAAITVAIINTGYIDKYISSISQASIFTGIQTYNK